MNFGVFAISSSIIDSLKKIYIINVFQTILTSERIHIPVFRQVWKHFVELWELAGYVVVRFAQQGVSGTLWKHVRKDVIRLPISDFFRESKHERESVAFREVLFSIL